MGAILGATAGLVIANNFDGISREIAVPICAITGGVIGHEYGQHRYNPDWRDRDYYDHNSRYYKGNRYNPYDQYDRHDRYNRHGQWDDRARFDRYDRDYRYYPRKTVTTQRYTPKKIDAVQFVSPDPHPGVDLIKVTVLNANGIRTDVPIRRINNQYIGPQGESYPSLPAAEQLRRRYGL
jgi:hypothetical protein